MDTLIERRQHRRQALCNPVHVRSKGRRLVEADLDTVDVSAGGMLLQGAHAFQTGDVLDVDLTVGDTSLELSGLVVGCRKGYDRSDSLVHIALTGMSAERRDAFFALLDGTGAPA